MRPGADRRLPLPGTGAHISDLIDFSRTVQRSTQETRRHVSFVYLSTQPSDQTLDRRG